jgi:hypothetical protein
MEMAAPNAVPQLWYYIVNGQRMGPVDLAQLRELLRSKQLNSKVPVWHDGLAQAMPADLLPPLMDVTGGSFLDSMLPIGRSGWAIAAGWLGLLSIVPFVGLLAIVISIVAIVHLRRNRDKKGWGRVVVGLLGGVASTALYGIALVNSHR